MYIPFIMYLCTWLSIETALLTSFPPSSSINDSTYIHTSPSEPYEQTTMSGSSNRSPHSIDFFEKKADASEKLTFEEEMM